MGHDVVIVDDVIDSGGTLDDFAHLLAEAGARNIYVCASHGIFSESSIAHLDNTTIKKVFVLNTLPLPARVSPKVEQLSIASRLADLIISEHFGEVVVEDEKFDDTSDD